MPEYPEIYQTRSNALEWVSLLGMWTEFARSAAALPADADGERWKSSMPHLIALLANGRALLDLGRVEWAEHPLALDRAAYAIREASKGLREIWGGEPMPEGVLETMGDARRAMDSAAWVADVVVYEGDGEAEVPEAPLEVEGLDAIETLGGFVLAATPGTVIRPGCAVACVRGATQEAIEAGLAAWWGSGVRVLGRGPGVQVYRQEPSSDDGAWVDRVIGLDAELPAGRPLLVNPGMALGNANAWRAAQRDAMSNAAHEVVWAVDAGTEAPTSV